MNRLVSNFILSLFVLLLMGIYGFTKQDTVSSYYLSKTNTNTTTMKQGISTVNQVVLPNGQEISVLVVKDEESRRKGLSVLDKLEENQGMLFVFEAPGPQSIWMKDMKFPIDIVWLDEKGIVVDVVRNAPVPAVEDTKLPVYTNQLPAKYVLELSAGTADLSDLKVGSVIQIS